MGQVAKTEPDENKSKRFLGGLFPPEFSKLLQDIGNEKKNRRKNRIKVEKLRPCTFTELRNNFVAKINSIHNSLESSKFVIKEGKIYKKYFVFEDPASYTKNKNYERLLKNIIRSRAIVGKQKKKEIEPLEENRFKRKASIKLSVIQNKLMTMNLKAKKGNFFSFSRSNAIATDNTSQSVVSSINVNRQSKTIDNKRKKEKHVWFKLQVKEKRLEILINLIMTELIDYYRERTGLMEKETEKFIKKIESIKEEVKRCHVQDFELRKRKSEIVELQKANTDLNFALDFERKKVLEMTHVVNQFKMQSNKDKARVAKLLELAEPLEQTMKVYYDKKPLVENRSKGTVKDIDPKSVSLAKMSNLGEVNIVRQPKNVNLEEVKNVDWDSEAVLHLKRQLSQQKSSYEDYIRKLEEDRRLREEEFRLFRIGTEKEINIKIEELQRAENRNVELTKDYLSLRYNTQLIEKQQAENIEKLKNDLRMLQDKLGRAEGEHFKYKKNATKDFERKTDNATQVMRGQVKKKEENLNIIKEQYSKISLIYNEKVKSLEEQLKSLMEKHKRLNEKNRNGMEGFINELRLIRERARSFESYFSKLKQLCYGDKDRRDKIKESLKGNELEELNHFGVNC